MILGWSLAGKDALLKFDCFNVNFLFTKSNWFV